MEEGIADLSDVEPDNYFDVQFYYKEIKSLLPVAAIFEQARPGSMTETRLVVRAMELYEVLCDEVDIETGLRSKK